jgi:TonB family protein
MRTSFERKLWLGIIILSMVTLISQCAWFRGDIVTPDLIKPSPVDGYDQLSTRIYYPKGIREQGIEGVIKIKAKISQTGVVLETRIDEPLHPELDKIAVNAIQRTMFYPATKDGEPLEVWISIPIVFALRDWQAKSSPFSSFEMLVYPNASYKSFKVQMLGKIKPEEDLPLRFELLLPLNAEKTWANSSNGSIKTERARDENGEWLIFQINEGQFDVGFNYEPIIGQDAQNFKYQLMLNHALPTWELAMIYGDQQVGFDQTPDRVSHEEDGSMRFSYDLERLEAYESRYLTLSLVK